MSWKRQDTLVIRVVLFLTQGDQLFRACRFVRRSCRVTNVSSLVEKKKRVACSGEANAVVVFDLSGHLFRCLCSPSRRSAVVKFAVEGHGQKSNFPCSKRACFACPPYHKAARCTIDNFLSSSCERWISSTPRPLSCCSEKSVQSHVPLRTPPSSRQALYTAFSLTRRTGTTTFQIATT